MWLLHYLGLCLLFAVFTKFLPELIRDSIFVFLAPRSCQKWCLLSFVVSLPPLLNNHITSKWRGGYFSNLFYFSYLFYNYSLSLNSKTFKQTVFCILFVFSAYFSIKTDVAFRVHHYIVLFLCVLFFSFLVSFIDWLRVSFPFKFLIPIFTLLVYSFTYSLFSFSHDPWILLHI